MRHAARRRALAGALLLLLALPFRSAAQQAFADSLRGVLAQASLPDTARSLTLSRLGKALVNSSADSARLLAEEALALAEKAQSDRAKGVALMVLANQHLKKGDMELAISTFGLAAQRSEAAQDWSNLGDVWHSTGVVHHLQGHYDEALSLYLKGLDARKRIGDREAIALSLNNIAIIYKQQGNYPKALEQFFGILQTLAELGKQETVNYGNAYNGIGTIYALQAAYGKAEEHYVKALEIYQKIGDKQKVALAYNNLADIYKKQGQHDRALEALLENYRISTEIGSKVNLSYSCVELADLYLLRGELGPARRYLDEGMDMAKATQSKERQAAFMVEEAKYWQLSGKTAEAGRWAQQAVEATEAIGSLELSAKAHEQRYLALKALGRKAEALDSHERFILLRDSMNNESNLRKAMGSEFEHREEQARAEQEKQALAHQAEIDRQRLVRNSLAGGATLMLALALVAYRSYRAKQRDNRLLEEQRTEIAEANKELNQANEELHQQQEELLMLNDNLETQKRAVETTYQRLRHTTDLLEKSIRYASHIQSVTMPEPEALAGFFASHFILYRPKDVVSGDFYWFSKISEERAVFALGDCTGHGVPGAFMSMLGCTLLHETVNVKGVADDPARILRNLHAGLQNILKQREGRNNDGMDISVCIFDILPESNRVRLSFAGAKSKMYCREAQHGEFTLLNGSKSYIGGKEAHPEFENQVSEWPLNATFYLFSDGYYDQNDEHRRKMGSAAFYNILRKHSAMPLADQRLALEQELDQHQGKGEQRDDITLVGLRVRRF